MSRTDTAPAAAAPNRGAQGDGAAPQRPERYLLLTALLAALLLAALALANYRLAPLSYSAGAQAEVARALASGSNHAVFDLNLDMRELRRQHIARLERTPEVIVLGASHWQEAHAGLLPGRRLYNAHVHRDYYEDLLAVAEMLIRHDRLPATLIISVRDMTFLPVERRTDTLWLSALPDYEAMAARLGIEPHPWLATRPVRRWQGLLSLPTMRDHALRRWSAATLPGPVASRSLPGMEVLQADGSIRWSEAHLAQFTPGRARDEVERAVAARQELELAIDPAAVTAVDRLLGLLTGRGVSVVLIHPPFNPAFYRQVEHAPYGEGLARVEALTDRLAATHGASAVGSFDPASAGCTEAMYIDAEHSRPACLARVLRQVPGL